jgi:adenine-specific DNA-methyltransferase
VPSVSVLYITDPIVGPHLELLRNVCEPTSKAKPHVTVRYFDRLAIPDDHLKTNVAHIDLVEPGAFGLSKADKQKNRTIFIRCLSEDLLPLEHKPYFPTSEFHITLYDGTSDRFARQLLAVLNEFDWSFSVDLPENTSLSAIKIKTKSRAKKPEELDREYSPHLKELFFEITGSILSFDFLKSLTYAKRLNFSTEICKHLMLKTRRFKKIEIQRRDAHSEAPTRRLTEDKYDIHLTPPELAESITSYALTFLDDKKPILFGDPAVGTGAFFGALLQAVPRNKIESAIGIDISPKQVEAARWRWSGKGMDVVLGDYLHMDKLSPRNLILANPPYMRHQGIPSDYKLELRQRASVTMGMRISGLSGQYVYFLLLSHQWMMAGAIAAWLIPSEFMQTSYGAALRHYFANKVTLIRVHKFGADDVQFENAEVLPCVVVFKNEIPKENHEISLTWGGSLLSPDHSESVVVTDLQTEGSWSIPRKSHIKQPNFNVRLGDLFSVRRGIATGANSYFILERAHAQRLGIPPLALKPLLPKIRNLDGDIVERQADGYPLLEDQLCVLDCGLSEEVISEKYPRLMDYLNDGRHQGILERYLVARRPIWYKQEQRLPAPFLCTYMGREHSDKPALRFIWNKSDAIATNTYLMLYPRPSLLRLLRDHDGVAYDVFNLLKEASLHSVRQFSRSHAGGLLKIEPSGLSEVWLPPLPPSLSNLVEPPLI